MRLLFVTPRFPYPALTGDRVVPFHRLRCLGTRHEITLLTLYADERELEGMPAIEPYCVAIHPVRLSTTRSLANLARDGLREGTPFQVLYYRSPEFQERLAALLRRDRFDLIDLFLLRLAPEIAPIRGIPKVLDLIDSMQLAVAERARLSHPPLRWVLQEEARRIAGFERSIGSAFDHLITVSARDRDLVRAPHSTVVPLGIDTELFAPARERAVQNTIVFSGNMAFPPNVEAVRWFADRCFPRIRAAVPDARLVVAGADPVREVRALDRRDGIRVTGFVESMADVLTTAQVAVAPMRSGSGMQNKVLEAMACGLPCVTTAIGARGIDARRGEEIILAEGAAELADSVIGLLREPARAIEIGNRARDFVVDEHSWDTVMAQAESVYESLVGGSAAPANAATAAAAAAP